MPPLVSVCIADFIWPDKADVMRIQEKPMPLKCNRHRDLWCNSEGTVCVADEAEGLQLRIYISLDTHLLPGIGVQSQTNNP